MLSGGAVAICGASAALAISAVLPRDKHHDRFTLMVVTVLSTVALVVVNSAGALVKVAWRG